MPTMPRSKRAPWMSERKAQERRTRPNQNIYNGKRWRALSIAHKIQNPLCEVCLANGITAAADVSDHIRPINQGGDPYDWNNIQSLCNTCHNRKSGRESHSTPGVGTIPKT